MRFLVSINPAKTRQLLNPAIPHQFPDCLHILPLAQGCIYPRKGYMNTSVIWLKLHKILCSNLSQLLVSSHPASSKQGAPTICIGLDRHLPYEFLCFV
uniref:Uncharacterized protein n=1 Tax=Arundo donax TaxID=35708 RepID=A0A0A9AYT6_ARUDO